MRGRDVRFDQQVATLAVFQAETKSGPGVSPTGAAHEPACPHSKESSPW